MLGTFHIVLKKKQQQCQLNFKCTCCCLYSNVSPNALTVYSFSSVSSNAHGTCCFYVSVYYNTLQVVRGVYTSINCNN